MLKIKIGKGEKGYPVYLHHGLLHNGGLLLKHHFAGGPFLLATDKNVFSPYGEICTQSMRQNGFKPYMVVLEGGEKDKTLQSAFKLYGEALKAGLDRKSFVVALGGGVIGDLAGFVAATYMRGIPFVQIPTTLLAMVDSSVGGKVGVNHPQGKNIIGSFYQPSLVLADLETLKTLPRRELAAGLAELFKYGIILESSLFYQIEFFLKDSFFELGSSTFQKLVAQAVLAKGRVVTVDEKETNFRRILNFGHTIGHALESATSYNYYLHGEAVAIGMMAATYLSVKLKILKSKDACRILKLLERLNPPLPPVGLNTAKVLQALYSDKKKDSGKLVFVLPSAIGKGVFYNSPPLAEIREVVERCLYQRPGNEINGLV